jgi:hypothetical protein
MAHLAVMEAPIVAAAEVAAAEVVDGTRIFSGCKAVAAVVMGENRPEQVAAAGETESTCAFHHLEMQLL